MKLGFTIFLIIAGVTAQALFSLDSFSMDKGIDIKSIVACKDCK